MKYLFERCYAGLICLCLMLYWPVANAHQMSTAYLQLSQSPLHVSPFETSAEVSATTPRLYGELQLRWFDLELVIGLDANTDGELSWAEVDARSTEIKGFVKQHLAILSAGNNCDLLLENDIQTDMHFDEGYLVLYFSSNCGLSVEDSQVAALTVQYSAIFTQDADHKLLINADLFQRKYSGVIDAQNQRYLIEPESNPLVSIISTYIYQGVLHIFKGTDHILFLCALLLTCVLQRVNHQWQAKPQVKQVLKDTAWIITAFTVAHSLTLTATAMDIIVPSSRWVEFGIALSVMLTALNNIWPVVLRLGWITFAFGLLHGMGFAGVLGELGIDKDQKLLSVIAFNLGVELGQLLILAALLPILLYVGKRHWYQKYGLQASSAIIALIALQWCITRF
ncbi:MAG: HupE/UreJ family protein [Paraglaciecola sp.]|nr:HupE/UreJ family protein [Paraglaciecola sp.]